MHDPAGQRAAQFSDAVFASKSFQDDPDLLFRRIILVPFSEGCWAIPCQAMVARLISLTIFSPGLLRIPVVCLMAHSSVVTMSHEYSFIKYGRFYP